MRLNKLHYTQAPTLLALLSGMEDHVVKADCAHLYGFEVGNFVKIGLSANPRQRLRNWLNLYESVGIDVGMSLLTAPIANAKEHEAKLHQTFQHRKKAGSAKEFFSISLQDLLDEIDRTEIIKHRKKQRITTDIDIKTTPDGFFSLTSIWRRFGASVSKTPARWAQNPSARRILIQARRRRQILSKPGRGGATYGHPDVASAYAEYLGADAAALVKELVETSSTL